MELFYIEPSTKIFTNLRDTIIKYVWNTYDNTYGYASEKIDYINGLENLSSNFMTMWQMLDIHNQQIVLDKIDLATFRALKERGGIGPWLRVPNNIKNINCQIKF